ncbi:MAG: D-glycerate dehydrogenase [Acidiferrobacteraceae bacterium]|nr:D-glycerate dehydrogenase [Acidiferrobacteraceae bacterium]
MKSVVCVTNEFPEAGLAVLRPHCELHLKESTIPPGPEELSRMADMSHGMITYLSDKIDGNIIDRGSKLKIIANYAAGFNNIDFGHAERKGIWVTNTPNTLHETTADLTWAMMLSAARKIIPANRFTREGKFNGWKAKLFLGHDIHGKVLGVIGCGEIGGAVARRALGFGMNVLYYQRNRLSENKEARLNVKYVSLERLLIESDFVTLHLPLNEDSRYMIGKEQFAKMKKTAFLINAARGQVVDDQALLEVVREGAIAGAALDVFEHEPEITQGMLEEDNILALPHIGSASYETRERMAVLAAENLLDVLIRNQKPRTPVNRPS